MIHFWCKRRSGWSTDARKYVCYVKCRSGWQNQTASARG